MLALDVVLAAGSILTYILAKLRCACANGYCEAAFNDHVPPEEEPGHR